MSLLYLTAAGIEEMEGIWFVTYGEHTVTYKFTNRGSSVEAEVVKCDINKFCFTITSGQLVLSSSAKYR